MSLEYLLDRMAIHDTIVRGCTAIDRLRPDLFDQVFTPDAVIDYSPIWGPDSYPAFRQWSKQWVDGASQDFAGWRHLLTNMTVEIDGDSASVATDYYNPLIGKDQSVIHSYASFHDTLVRTPQGWRIAHRKCEPVRAPDPAALY